MCSFRLPHLVKYWQVTYSLALNWGKDLNSVSHYRAKKSTADFLKYHLLRIDLNCPDISWICCVLVCMILTVKRCFHFSPLNFFFPRRHLSKCVKSEAQRSLKTLKAKVRQGWEVLLIFFFWCWGRMRLPCREVFTAHQHTGTSPSRGFTKTLSVIDIPC